jgi:uncharacterized protein
MAKHRAIVDTSFLVGALDRSDQWHEWARRLFPSLLVPVLTCEAVISESCFQLREWEAARHWLLGWIASGTLVVKPMLPEDHAHIAELLERYGARMDYADACLLALRRRYPNHAIATADLRDFRIYRDSSGLPPELLGP